MLSDYINDYIDAIIAKDEKKMRKIEKELARIGMDRYTLVTLAKEEYLNRLKEEKK